MPTNYPAKWVIEKAALQAIINQTISTTSAHSKIHFPIESLRNGDEIA